MVTELLEPVGALSEAAGLTKKRRGVAIRGAVASFEAAVGFAEQDRQCVGGVLRGTFASQRQPQTLPAPSLAGLVPGVLATAQRELEQR